MILGEWNTKDEEEYTPRFRDDTPCHLVHTLLIFPPAAKYR